MTPDFWISEKAGRHLRQLCSLFSAIYTDIQQILSSSWDYCRTYRMALKRWLQAALCFLQCGSFAYGSIKSVPANSPQSTFGRLKWKMQLLESNIKLFLKCRDLLHQAIHPVLLYSTNVSTGDIYLHIYTTHQRAWHIFAPVFMFTYRLEPLLHSNCSNTQKDEGKK